MIEATMVWVPRAARRFIKDPYRWLAKLDHAGVLSGLRQRKISRTLPRCVRSVLFVCKGNICRSPLAAAYFEAKLREQECQIEVRSAGLETTAGKEAHPLARIIAQQHDLSLQAHMTTPLTQELVDRADLILVMEFVHCSKLFQMHPEAEGKVFQLGYFSNMLLTQIADPYDGTLADFESCYQVIRRSCDHLLGYLMDTAK